MFSLHVVCDTFLKEYYNIYGLVFYVKYNKIYKVFKMDFLIANVEHLDFKIERDLNEQYGALPLPFPGMDSKWGYNIVMILY